MSKQTGDDSAFGVAAGSAVYHLIEEGWEMRADDEALDSGCASWWRLDSHPSGRWMIGAPYTRQLFVPIRRAGKYHYAPNNRNLPLTTNRKRL